MNEELAHTVHQDGRIITFTWIGEADVTPARVRAFAFTPEGSMLLVSGAAGDPCCYLPGGGIEGDETPEAALRRELMEEAAATVHALKRIGFERMEERANVEYHAFYWCRITLADDAVPELDRYVVPPEAFLDTFHWAKTNPTAEVLFGKALALERRFGQG